MKRALHILNCARRELCQKGENGHATLAWIVLIWVFSPSSTGTS